MTLAAYFSDAAYLATLHPLAGIVASCGKLMNQFDSCTVRHIYREKNCVADGLANWSYNMGLGVCYFDFAPSWIGSLVIGDLIGVSRPRLFCVDLL
ncbi:unnamed protein product [Prunus armeniaca]